jgi:hypothetical protein
MPSNESAIGVADLNRMLAVVRLKPSAGPLRHRMTDWKERGLAISAGMWSDAAWASWCTPPIETD